MSCLNSLSISFEGRRPFSSSYFDKRKISNAFSTHAQFLSLISTFPGFITKLALSSLHQEGILTSTQNSPQFSHRIVLDFFPAGPQSRTVRQFQKRKILSKRAESGDKLTGIENMKQPLTCGENTEFRRRKILSIFSVTSGANYYHCQVSVTTVNVLRYCKDGNYFKIVYS